MTDNNEDELRMKEQAQREQDQRDEDERRRMDEQALLTASASAGESSAPSSGGDKSVKKSFISAHTDDKVRNNMRSAGEHSQKTVKDSRQDDKAAAKQSGSIWDVLSPGQKVGVSMLAVGNAIVSLQMSQLSARMSNQSPTKDSSSMESKAAEWQKLHDAAKMRSLKIAQGVFAKVGSAVQNAARTGSQHSRQKNNVDLVGARGSTEGAARTSFADVSNAGASERETPYIETVSDDADVQMSM